MNVTENSSKMTTLHSVLGMFKTRNFKILLIVLFVFYFITFLAPSFVYSDLNNVRIENEHKLMEQNRLMHIALWEEFYARRVKWETSNLGSILFKNHDTPPPRNRGTPYVILVWKYWNWLKSRHVEGFGHNRTDPLYKCSVKNCIFTGDDKELDTADAVLIHLQKGVIPQVERRNPSQRWIFLNDESPKNAFSLATKKIKWQEFSNVFNWSMSYRADADVPVPYGRTVPFYTPIVPNLRPSQVATLIPNWENKRFDTIATVLMSNCGVTSRNNFIKELKKYINVDVYGKCSDDNSLKNGCPGHFRSDCEPVSKYLFYLVLENSICEQYLTEKIFYHAYSKGAIPVIVGASFEECKALLPPNSFIHIDQFESVELLANSIKSLADNVNMLLVFHSWRNNFQVLNEHGYFGSDSFHLCRICEALNYNDENVKVYTEKNLARYFDTSLICSNSMS